MPQRRSIGWDRASRWRDPGVHVAAILVFTMERRAQPNEATFNEYVYEGMYLGWIVESGFVSADIEAETDFTDLISEFRVQKANVSDLYASLGETLTSDMLSDEANRFTASYFDTRYEKDYREILAPNGMACELVAVTWENFDRIRARLEERYPQWKSNAASVGP